MVRAGRTFDRLMFRCAKHFHDLHHNIDTNGNEVGSLHSMALKQGQGSGHGSQTDQFLDRAFIRRWKTKIYRFLERERDITMENFDQYTEDEIISMVTKRFKND